MFRRTFLSLLGFAVGAVIGAVIGLDVGILAVEFAEAGERDMLILSVIALTCALVGGIIGTALLRRAGARARKKRAAPHMR